MATGVNAVIDRTEDPVKPPIVVEDAKSPTREGLKETLRWGVSIIASILLVQIIDFINQLLAGGQIPDVINWCYQGVCFGFPIKILVQLFFLPLLIRFSDKVIYVQQKQNPSVDKPRGLLQF